MDADSRACVAFIAAKLISAGHASSVFDHGLGRHKNVSGTISAASVAAFDHDRGTHISGTGAALFDHGRGAHITLTVDGHDFNGFDHGSGQHFSGNVSGHCISLFDHGAGTHFNYSV